MYTTVLDTVLPAALTWTSDVAEITAFLGLSFINQGLIILTALSFATVIFFTVKQMVARRR